ncbi:MAG: RHS repeat-associated core domain-containing protein, partial [Candidatus Electrothrix sp. AR1]|nr:RHS repeat-associated core domain-containing protein [Candidatus Electrothrix sp. AR1]
RDSSNAVLREYTWGLNRGGGIGGLLDVRQGGQNYSYLYDGKGNVDGLIDDAEAMVAGYVYSAFGRLLTKTGTLDQPFRFSTKAFDEQTGLAYYGYRFYSPGVGRWINRDPIGEAGGINLYGFVGNDPVDLVDTWGLFYYNKPPPATVPVAGKTLDALNCLEKCLQDETDDTGLCLRISGGAEKTGHSKNSHHGKGTAIDVAGTNHNSVNQSQVFKCAEKCSFKASIYEHYFSNPWRDHWHLQLEPGNGVNRNPGGTVIKNIGFVPVPVNKPSAW